ncbi:hypothetical protein [Massilia glaciei]|nr:hypothetical protein [Massilia glaciei]
MGDWARFSLDQLAGAKGRGKLLTPASYRLTQTARPGGPAGLDWGVQASVAGRRGPALVHQGSDGDWLAIVALFPSLSPPNWVPAWEGIFSHWTANPARRFRRPRFRRPAKTRAIGRTFPFHRFGPTLRGGRDRPCPA